MPEVYSPGQGTVYDQLDVLPKDAPVKKTAE
jgi:hypothetical protein